MIYTRRQGFCRSGLLLLIISSLWLVAPGANAQSRATVNDINQRLKRVERVLDQSLLNLLQQVDNLQGEIRQLRGENETLINDVESLKKRNRDLYIDTDRRISELESAGSPSLSVPGEFDEASLPEIVPPDESAIVVPNVSVNANPGNGPAAPVTPVTGATTRAATAAEKSAYTKAYDLLARGQNQSAVSAFDEFLNEFPDGPYSDNAWYWQGEAKYAQRNFDQALRNFNVVVGSFPNSPKVPDARLKIGFALFEQQRYGEARQILTGVQNDYPGRSAAVLARKRLQQMDREGR